MLFMNVRRIMNLRGITRHYSYLVKNGFIRTTATNLSNNQARQIKFDMLEELCLLFNCTPNDLFQWQPDENQSVNDDKVLKSLIRENDEQSISQIVKNIPLEKLERAKDLLRQLNDGEVPAGETEI